MSIQSDPSSSRENVGPPPQKKDPLHPPPQPPVPETTDEERFSRMRRENKIRINVGGNVHETYKSTLRNIPDTRLSWLTNASPDSTDFDPGSGEFFFDRHPAVFAQILNYYRTGKLHAPTDVCGPLFEEELAFWGIDEKQIEACCWMSYTEHRDAQKTISELEGPEHDENEDDDDDGVARRFGIEEEDTSKTWFERWQPKIWKLMEEPGSSAAARLMMALSLIFIVLAVSVICMETVKDIVAGEQGRTILVTLELVSTVWFIFELGIRFAFSPSRPAFCLTLLNIIDFLATVISIITISIHFASGGEDTAQSFNATIGFLKVFRVFRIMRLTRHVTGLKILGHTMKASAKELGLLCILVVLAVVIFASMMYYAEQLDKNVLRKCGTSNTTCFTNIPIGFWWALVTMTTVGYGDMYPITTLGYILGSACAICGVLVIALPVPFIVNNFTSYYNHAQAKAKLPKKPRRILIGAADALKNHTVAIIEDGPSDTSDPSGTDRKESASDSLDSGINSATGEVTSISVVFTDETTGNGVVIPCGLPAYITRSPNKAESRKPPRRESFVPGAGGPGPNRMKSRSGSFTSTLAQGQGRKGPPPRRRSFIPGASQDLGV